MHRVREVEGELQRDQGARGMADDVRALDPQMAHEEPTLVRVVGHADWPLDRTAVSEAGSVVPEEAVAISEGRLLDEGLRPRCAHAPVDQDDGLAGSAQLVGQLDAVDGRPLHPFHDNLAHRQERD